MFHGSPAAVAASAAVAEMRFTTGGSSTRSWEPTVTADTSDLHYWMQWRAAVCALSVLACMAVAACLVWRHEGPGAERRPGGASGGGRGSKERRRPGVLYDDEAWRPCLRDIHPAWLLGYRLISFFVLLSLLIVIVISDGGTIFYYYTQWTFILVTIYFGLGTALSIYGCSKLADENVVTERTDMELGSYVAHGAGTKPNLNGEDDTGEIAGFWGYLLQIIYQTNAGAVMLTDCVFWFIIFPFLTVKDYNLNFLLIGMHSVNAVFLLGEAALNSLVLRRRDHAITMLRGIQTGDQTETPPAHKVVSGFSRKRLIYTISQAVMHHLPPPLPTVYTERAMVKITRKE
uniref:Uncharacterized protein n=1 Tax=Oryza nivara TaxID=4536 RepID=A0A0E0G0L4_ORYNI